MESEENLHIKIPISNACLANHSNYFLKFSHRCLDLILHCRNHHQQGKTVITNLYISKRFQKGIFFPYTYFIIK